LKEAMRAQPFADMNCSLARALSVVGERWSLLIIREAVMGSSRFDAFHQRLGVARNILQTRLEALVNDGIMRREASTQSVRIHHYVLTDKGWDLFHAIAALMQWGDRWMDDGKGAPVLLIDPRTGAPINSLKAGAGIDPQRVMLRPGPGADKNTVKRMSANTQNEASPSENMQKARR
jgi:DNA-binding HxlR family transcriptional regulator